MPNFAVIYIIILSVFALTARAEAAPKLLSLNEAVSIAVEKNLDVRAEFYNPAQFEADINRNRAIYDPVLNVQTSYSDSSAVQSNSAGSASDTEVYTFNSSISQLFWSGGTAALNFNNTHNSNNSPTTLPNYWQSGVGISFSQPLLKNSGREATEANIRISQISKYASLERLRTKLLTTVAQVRNEYFKLYTLRETMAVKKVSLELASKILNETKARVAAGVFRPWRF